MGDNGLSNERGNLKKDCKISEKSYNTEVIVTVHDYERKNVSISKSAAKCRETNHLYDFI